MRNIFLITFIFLCSMLFGQEESKTSIAGGAKALVFEFDGLAYLAADSYEGGIGAKMFFNRNLALRFVFNFDRYSEEEPANPPTGFDGAKGEYVSTSFGLGAGLEYHLRSTARVSPYFGGGFGFARLSSEEKPDAIWFSGSDVYREIETYKGGYNFDMMGVIGAELFVMKEVSLSAEYMFNLRFFNDGDIKYTYVVLNGTPATPDSYTEKGNSGWSIGTGSRGRLILSIYF
jgi:hypothetical protein